MNRKDNVTKYKASPDDGVDVSNTGMLKGPLGKDTNDQNETNTAGMPYDTGPAPKPGKLGGLPLR